MKAELYSAFSADPLRSLRLYFSLVFFLILSAPTVYSQDKDTLTVVTLPTTIVTATRIPTITTSVNRSYDIITPSGIQAAPPLTIEEILHSSALTGIQSRGPFGVQTDISIRGSAFSQNLVLLNGQRLNDPQTGHHTFDIPVSIDEIERIEIIKGNGSTQYGADAYAGVMNIITRQPSEGNASVRIAGGQYGFFSGTGSVTAVSDNIQSQNTIELRKSDGFRPDTEFSIWNISTNNRIQSPIGNYSLLGGYTGKKFGAFDFYSPGRNAPSKEKTSAGWISLGTDIIADKFILRPKAYFRRHTDEFRYLPSSIPSEHTTTMEGGEVTAMFQPGRFSTILAGVESNWDDIRSTTLGNHHRSTQAFFGTFQTLIDSVISFDAGIRQDWHSDFSSQLSPSFGLGYLFAGATKVFASAGRSFRAPSYTDLYYHDPANVGNPNLEPEVGWSYEVGFRNSSIQDLEFSGALFRRDQKNLIDYVEFFDGDLYHAVNFTKAKTTGGEIGLEWSSTAIRISDLSRAARAELSRGESRGFGPAPSGSRRAESRRVEGFQISGLGVHYLYLDTKIDRGNSFRTKYSLNNPRHTISGTCTIEIPGDISASIAGTWKQRPASNAYTLIDAGISKDFHPVNVFLKAQNILGTRYEEIVGVPQPGRWLWAGVEVRLK